MPDDITRTTAAAAMAPPIQIFRLELPFCSLISLLLKFGHCWESPESLADLPEPESGASLKVDPITRGAMKDWRTPSSDRVCCEREAITDATRPSGGYALGTRARSSNSRFSSSNSERARGSAASVRSSSRASSDVASPSRTACINSVSGVIFMFNPAEGPSACREGDAAPRTSATSPFSRPDPGSDQSPGSCTPRSGAATAQPDPWSTGASWRPE